MGTYQGTRARGRFGAPSFLCPDAGYSPFARSYSRRISSRNQSAWYAPCGFEQALERVLVHLSPVIDYFDIFGACQVWCRRYSLAGPLDVLLGKPCSHEKTGLEAAEGLP